MTPPDHDAIEAYLRQVADLLRLRDWTLELSDEPTAPEHDGHVCITYGRKLATVSLHSNFATSAPDEQRHTVVHELIHCHLEAASNQVRNDLERHLGEQADRLFWEAFRRNMEYGVDGLADAVAPLMPLPPWTQPEPNPWWAAR